MIAVHCVVSCAVIDIRDLQAMVSGFASRFATRRRLLLHSVINYHSITGGAPCMYSSQYTKHEQSRRLVEVKKAA